MPVSREPEANPESKSFMIQCQFEVLLDVTPVVPLDVNNNVHPSLVILSPAIKLESQCQKG